jgi:hypothetical protein
MDVILKGILLAIFYVYVFTMHLAITILAWSYFIQIWANFFTYGMELASWNFVL